MGLVMRPPQPESIMDKQLQNEVILGVDTHLDTHVAAIVNFAGKLLGVLATPTTAAGYLQLLS